VRGLPKLFERVYAPLTAGMLHPIPSNTQLRQHKRTKLERLYRRITEDLDKLLNAVGLKLAA
jgi:hypothetical protein